jgi:hypothetical protein
MRFQLGIALMCTALFACSDDAGTATPRVVIGPGLGEAVVQVFDVPDQIPPPDAPVALIMDAGFDLSIESLRAKVAGAYTIVCEAAAESTEVTDFDTAKAQALASMAVKDTRCHLERGIKLKYSAWADTLVPLRDGWNAAVGRRTLGKNTDESEFLRVIDVLEGEKTYLYHGTSTLGLLAQVAPANARFVIVDRELRLPTAPTPKCPSQASLDTEAKLARDPDVVRAYVAQPLSKSAEELAALRVRFHVQFENRSFGFPPLEVRQTECPGLSLDDSYRAEDELYALDAKERAPRVSPNVDVLLTVSSGNDALRLDSSAAAGACALAPSPLGPASARLVVGSYGPRGTPSPFSNRGACTDLYAPGESLVTPGIRGFLVPFGGTSAAAPVALGLAMLLTPLGATAQQRKAFMLQQRDSAGRLPVRLFPEDLPYERGAYAALR